MVLLIVFASLLYKSNVFINKLITLYFACRALSDELMEDYSWLVRAGVGEYDNA